MTNNILVWLLVGFITGVIMYLIDKRELRGGILATILVGMFGAILGGILSSALFGIGISGLNSVSIIIAVVGGLVFSFVQRIATSTKQQRGYKFERGAAYYSNVYPHGNGKKTNPIQVQSYLDGVDYPATRNDLIRVAIRHGARENIIETLQSLPEETYYSPANVSQDLKSH